MDHNAVIAQIFQQFLGRAPSQAEMQGFGTALANGVVDPVGLSLFIQGSSEYQKSKIGQGVQGYSDQLTSGNKQIMDQGFDQAQSRFAKQGRPESSGLSSAYAQVSGNLAAQQSPMIAQYYGNLYGNSQNNPYGQAYMNNQQQQVQNQWQAGQNNTQRDMERDQFSTNIRQQRENNWFQLGGSLLGAGGQAAGGYLSK